MVLIKIHVEGQTEERFVKEILYPHLKLYGHHAIAIINKTSRRQRGGLSTYQQFKKNTLRLRDQKGSYVTTMIDRYHIPTDFPGYEKCGIFATPLEEVEFLEERLAQDIEYENFIPYIQLHEFEALLFSNILVIDKVLSVSHNSRLAELEGIMQVFHQNPENINHHKGPSCRLKELYPGYGKIFHGIRIANEIGLLRMRKKCSHFHDWVSRLEGL